jgi:hypothetical protein
MLQQSMQLLVCDPTDSSEIHEHNQIQTEIKKSEQILYLN